MMEWYLIGYYSDGKFYQCESAQTVTEAASKAKNLSELDSACRIYHVLTSIVTYYEGSEE